MWDGNGARNNYCGIIFEIWKKERNMRSKKNEKIVFIETMLLLLFLTGCSNNDIITGKAVDTTNNDAKEFSIKAFQFRYEPDTINVNNGDKVKVIINNVDVLHGIMIPDLGIKGNDIIEFTADKEEEFMWYCTNMCGEGHRQMKGKLVVK